MHKCCSSWLHDMQSRDKKVVPVLAHFCKRYRWYFEGWLLISPSGKLHCVLIEIFSHSSRRTDWFRLISHTRGHYCIVTRLNHRPSPMQGWYKKSYTSHVFCQSIDNREIFNFICPYLPFVNLGVFSLSFHNIESTQITQLIVDNFKRHPFLRDAMYSRS